MGDGAGQPRCRACDARGARERDGASGGGGGGVSRGTGGKDARAGATRLGDDADELWKCTPEIGRAGERDGASGGGRGGLERVPSSQHLYLAARMGSNCRNPP